MSTTIKLTKCDDIRCFSEKHRSCPICFDIFHLDIDSHTDILGIECSTCSTIEYSIVEHVEHSTVAHITKCNSVLCFSADHRMCPSCYRNIHVKI